MKNIADIILLLALFFVLLIIYQDNEDAKNNQECHVLPPAIMAPTTIEKVW